MTCVEHIIPIFKFKFKTSMLKSSLCNYSNAHIIVKGTIRIPNTAAAATASNNANKKVILKNCAPFTDCISNINNIRQDKTLMS